MCFSNTPNKSLVVLLWFLESKHKKRNSITMWAPTRYKWSYNPYKWPYK